MYIFFLPHHFYNKYSEILKLSLAYQRQSSFLYLELYLNTCPYSWLNSLYVILWFFMKLRNQIIYLILIITLKPCYVVVFFKKTWWYLWIFDINQQTWFNSWYWLVTVHGAIIVKRGKKLSNVDSVLTFWY